MKRVTELKALGDIRTAVRARIHSKTPQKGTAHRDLYLLSKEKDRLEKGLARLDRERKRILDHLVETFKALGKLQQKARGELEALETTSEPAECNRPATASQHPRGRWRTVPLDY
ncbi:MAG: hypothetical protein HYY00_01420 [Chloroflexi bacterium]|nr:hypothetical protein [Chloroflexota bacterium]